MRLGAYLSLNYCSKELAIICRKLDWFNTENQTCGLGTDTRTFQQPSQSGLVSVHGSLQFLCIPSQTVMADIKLHHFSLENKVSIHCRNSTLKPFHLRQLCDSWCNVTYAMVDVFVHGSLFAPISMATSTSREDCFNTKSQFLQLIPGEPLSTGEVYPSHFYIPPWAKCIPLWRRCVLPYLVWWACFSALLEGCGQAAPGQPLHKGSRLTVGSNTNCSSLDLDMQYYIHIIHEVVSTMYIQTY